MATLHVYTNLIQIPVLVLDSRYEPVAPILDSRFFISLDSGKPFRPRHVRREGNDAISLAIITDNTDDPTWLRPVAAQAIAKAIPGSLDARDHVTVYTLSCRFYREFDDLPSLDVVGPMARDEIKPSREKCERPVHLWDSIAFATRKLGELPGRRVVLVISDGGDRGSHATWNEVREQAVSRSVAIFALNSNIPSGPPTIDLSLRAQLVVHPEDAMRSLCELTGGIVLHAQRSEKEVGRAFTRFVQLLRDRYIVEFPRLDSMSAGAHDIVVTVPGRPLVIRPAGNTATIADAAQLADPMTIPAEPDDREAGTRKVLSPDK